MTASKISFRFIASGDSASYEVIRYGHPDNGRRVELQTRAYALYARGGRRRYGYTIGQYMRQVVSVLGFLHWEFSSWEPLPDEYARAFVEWSRQSYDETIARFKTRSYYDPQDWPAWECPIKGTAQYVFDETNPNEGHWIKTRLTF